MTKYKDLPENKIAGRFDEKENGFKHYGKEEIVVTEKDLSESPRIADILGNLFRFGDDITKKEYLSK